MYVKSLNPYERNSLISDEISGRISETPHHPVYQRNYDWKKENCKQLFDDLVSVIKERKETHFFGSIVSYAHSRDEVVLIDGQQRITTVSLILIAILNAMKSGTVTTKDDTLPLRIEDFLVDKYDKTERKVRLKPFRDDCVAFDRLIYKDASEYIPESNVTINYRFLRSNRHI